MNENIFFTEVWMKMSLWRWISFVQNTLDGPDFNDFSPAKFNENPDHLEHFWTVAINCCCKELIHGSVVNKFIWKWIVC